jgi:hypothetical protein
MEKSYRLIVARYNENLDWIDAFDNYQIYNKGEKNLSPKHQANAIQLPNVGREAHTYLYHIINNYDKLEDILIFCQGSIVGHTYDSDVNEFKKHALDIDQNGFSTEICDIAGIDYGPPGTGDNSWHFTLLSHHDGKLYYLGEDGKPRDASLRPHYNISMWWERVTGEPYVRSQSVFWGATFSVKREFILKRSLDSYMRIFGTLCGHKSSLEAHFCERTWFNILNLPMDFRCSSRQARATPQESKPKFGVSELLRRCPNEERSAGRRIRVKRKNSFRPLSRDELTGVLDEAGDILFKDEETLRSYSRLLTENIRRWKEIKCPEIPEKIFYSKADLEEKQKWYVKDMDHESMSVTTSGSTTGQPFEYKRWHPAFHKIEWDYHYNMVLDEFEVPEDFHLLYFFSSHYRQDGNNPVMCLGHQAELPMQNHGSSRRPVVHFANFAAYSTDQESFFAGLFEYLERNPIDVFYTSSPQINSMCNYIRKLGFKGKVGKLLSSTNDRIIQRDAKFLVIDNGYFENICDHMRCWDGGASFFTCKYGNYHLMDNLSWCEEVDGKMVCTDYFNLASPFYKYWNGDYCSISDSYQRCDCGRLYREFEFLESRPFSLKGTCMIDIKNAIKMTGIQGVKQVRCSTDFLDVITTREFSDEEKRSISSVDEKFKFRFMVENH